VNNYRVQFELCDDALVFMETMQKEDNLRFERNKKVATVEVSHNGYFCF